MSGHDERGRCELLWAIERIDGATHHLEVNHERRAGIWWAQHEHPARWNWDRTRDSIAISFDAARRAEIRAKGLG